MKKNFNCFTESYEIIRQTLRDLFVYGCYDSSVGAERQKISGRKYSDELKRIRYFWSKQISARRHGEKKINFFPFNRYPDGENYLLRSYQIHSFKPQDLNLYIYLLQILSDAKTYSVTELIDEVQFRFSLDTDYAGIFYPMMSRKLEEMTTAGLLVRIGKSSYRLAEDILEDFSSEELLHLHRILFLYRELLPLSSVGSQLQQVLGDYLRFERGELDLPNSCFWFEDIFYQSVLNDEIFYKLIIALEQRRRIAFLLPKSDRLVADAIPRQIIFDCQYGRQYLAGEAEEKFFFWRLDNISNVRLLEKFDDKNLPDKNFLQYIWNASAPKTNEPPARIEIDFIVSEEETHFLRRLEAEKRFGEVKQLDKNHCLFSIELFDPNEIIPWIRSFGHVASVRPSEQHNLREKLEREWAEALANYLEPAKVFDAVALSYPASKKFSPNDLPATEVKQPEFFSEFRNAFYRAVLCAYNEILINGEQFDKETLATYIGKNSFDFDKKFSLRDSLIQEIISCGDEIKKFSLFSESGKILIPTYNDENFHEIPEPQIRFLDIEKRWLKTLLNAPLAENLLGKNLFDKLNTALKNISPFPFEKCLTKNGQRTDGDNFDDPKLAERILFFMEAIDKKIFITYKQKANNGKEYSGVFLPIKIIYSPYLKKFQLRVAIREGEAVALKLINIANFTYLEKSQNEELFLKMISTEPPAQNFLKLRIFPIHNFNDIERCFLLFSANRKEGYFDLKNNVYHLTVYYRNFERRALHRKILSLGKAVVIDEPAQLRDKFLSELKIFGKKIS